MTAPPVIAFDGPGGAGKGTVGRAVAARLGWHYLDSGALYRMAALAALRAGLEADADARIAALIAGLTIEFCADSALLDGEDVGRAIRSEEAGRMASTIAATPAVRDALIARQRAFRQAPGLVADGRDMGTVVFPDALVKIFLIASPEERARRRYKQLKEQGIDVRLPRLERELCERDARDAARRVAPLRPAPDAIRLDTEGQPVSRVVARSLLLASEAAHRRGITIGL